MFFRNVGIYLLNCFAMCDRTQYLCRLFVFNSKKYVELALYCLRIGLDIAGCKHTDLADLHNTDITPIRNK
jgi:hypothetical protein